MKCILVSSQTKPLEDQREGSFECDYPANMNSLADNTETTIHSKLVLVISLHARALVKILTCKLPDNKTNSNAVR